MCTCSTVLITTACQLVPPPIQEGKSLLPISPIASELVISFPYPMFLFRICLVVGLGSVQQNGSN